MDTKHIVMVVDQNIDSEDEYRWFDRFIKQNNDKIYAVCRYYYCGDKYGADEIVSSAVLRCWKSRQKMMAITTEKERQWWCLCIVKNEALRWNSKTVREVVGTVPEVVDMADDKDELLSELYELIDQLPAEDMTIVRLYIERRKLKDIATELQMSISAVAMRINRVKHRLKDMYLRSHHIS